MPINNALTPEGQNSLGAAFGYYPQLRRQGQKARELALARDVNTLPDPRTYAAVSGLLGTAPDEMGFSVMHPDYQGIRGVADPAYALGIAAGVAPAVAQPVTMATLEAARAARQAALATGRTLGPTAARMSEEYLQRQGLMPGVLPAEGRAFQYPQKEALRLAQQRAALPVEQGGLGLPAGNTAAQRAKAMGFDTNLYHGTTDPTIKRFDPSLAGKKSSNPFDENVFATSSPQNAGGYALNWKSYKNDVETSPAFQALSNQENSIARQFADLPAGPSAAKQDLSAQLESVRLEKNKIYNDFMEGKYVSEDATIYPLKARSQDFFPYDAAGKNWIRANRPAIDAAQQAGFEGTAIQNVKDNAGRWTDVVADSYATTNPDLFRSRFAAFDPFRRNAAIAAAMGVAAPNLLAAEAEQDAYARNELRKFKRQSAR